MASIVEEQRLSGFDRAIECIAGIVGESYLLCDDDAITDRSRVIIPTACKPSAYVYPGSLRELQDVVKVANRYNLPLWPCSKGKNWGYGSTTPAEDGALVVVLERLNQILEFNAELAYVVVEPGVTYRQLHQFLQQRGGNLWLDCTDGPADASVMGNALERGIGETPYGDHFGNLCGMEVVLADGSLFRTGGGPVDGYKSWTTYKWGVGPYLEGLFSQSNFGIVSKIGMWLMPRPERFVSCVFELTDEGDFPAMIDALRRLQFNGALQSKVHIVNDFVAFAIASKYPREMLNGQTHLSEANRMTLRKQWNIASWTFAAGVYGTAAQVRANLALIKRELKRYGKLQFIGDRKIRMIDALGKSLQRMKSRPWGSAVADFLIRRVIRKPLPMLEFLPQVHAIEKGYPSDYFVKHAYYKARVEKPADQEIDPPRDNCGLIWLGPMVPLDGRHMTEILDLCKPLYEQHGFEFSTALMIGNPRTAIALMSIFFDKEDPGETQRAKDLYFEMGRVTQQAGYQQYRTSTAFMSRILDPAPEFQQVAERIKAALDPNGILAPGKYGIGGNPTTPAPSTLSNTMQSRKQ